MKNIYIYICIAVVLTILFSQKVSYSQSHIEYSEIIVKLKSVKNITYIHYFANNHAITAHALFTENEKNKTSNSKIWLIYALKLNQPDDGTFLAELKNSESIEWACYKTYPTLLYKPNDPAIPSQYYLSLIKAFDAWDISMGDSTIIVGIVDTGIDPNHPEIINQIAYNYNDPVNGIDDDGDGFIDNYFGWNIAENNYNITADINPHGVGISGIVAAQANNNIGMAGVAPGIKIMPVKIMNNRGLLSASYEGIVYAAEHGCKIIVCSWGGVLGSPYGEAIVNYVTHELGVLIVAAAGNSRNEDLYYPASYPGVLSVLASNGFDHKWEGSTYGYRVDLAAPGHQIYSTAFGGGYSFSSGTSNAAPIAAGAAAIIASLRPHLTPIQIASQLKTTAYWIDTLPANQPYQNKLGAGRVDLHSAIADTNRFYPTIAQNIIEPNEAIPGESYMCKGEIQNVLSTTSAVTVSIAPMSEFVSITNSMFTVNNWKTNQAIQLSDQNIRLSFADNIPLDTVVPIKFGFTYGNKTLYIIRTIRIKKSWVDLNSFDLKMTLASNGKPAYQTLSPIVGNGFRTNSSGPLLWECGLVIGNAANKIVSAIGEYNDFVASEPATLITDNNSEKAFAKFNDSHSVYSLGLDYSVEASSGNQYPLSAAIVYKITLKNRSNNPINDLRIGMFANWIVPTDGIITTNQDLHLVSTSSVGQYPFAHGIAILSPVASINNYSFDTGSMPEGININDNLTRDELWQAMINSREMTEPLDVSTPAHLLSTGDINLEPNEEKSITFAFLTDTHIDQLENHVLSLRNVVTMENVEVVNESVFPNPAVNQIRIESENSSGTIYSISGVLMCHWENKSVLNLDISSWDTGIYTIHFSHKKSVRSARFVVIR